MYSWDQLVKANESCKSMKVKDKDYVEVNQRIKAFRMLCPGGSILTEMLSNENGICVFKATICDDEMRVLGTGTAYEKETSSYINKTSYIENCETSAVGRALGMCGFGIDTSIASAEEVQNAILNQNKQNSGDGQKAARGGKQPSYRDLLVARLRELGIDVHAYSEANGLRGCNDPERFRKCLEELEHV